MTKHSSGRINTTHDRFDRSTESFANLRRRFLKSDELSVDSFYDTVRSAGLDYDEKFRSIKHLWHQNHAMLAQLELHDDLVAESRRTTFHPALFDACLHVLFADVHRNGDPDRVYLPYRIDRVRFYQKPTKNVWSHVKVTRNDDRYLCSDTVIFDDTGEIVAEVRGLTCKRLAGAGSRSADTLYEGCYEYRWIESAPVVGADTRISDFTRCVLLFGPPSPSGNAGGNESLAADLAKRLAAEDIQPSIIRTNPHESLDQLLADVPLDRRTLIVFAGGLSSVSSRREWTSLADCPWVPAMLQLAQTLHRREGVPRLCVVTNGAAGVADDQHLDLGQAVLHGMARVVNNECPNVPVTVIDLSESMPMCEVNALFDELLHCRRDRDESEVALRGTQRFVRQLEVLNREAAEQSASTIENGVGGAYRADVSDPGMLDQIVFRQLPRSAFGDDDVEIAVQAAALNFKDIMNAMGMLPAEAVAGGLTSHRLGLEVAGSVVRTGRLVKQLQVGDEVMARVAEGFCGRVIAHADYVVRKPDCLTPSQASAVLLVYVTAWYSLCHLARIARGEAVLIHSAAGGVGGAAIQLAHRAGATVIATAGTKERREHLRQIGVKHVFDSRSLDFYNHVMEVTNGRGVDIVLNSLTGRFITQSLKCLAPFGRFVEIGKSDIYRNSKLGLERLGENISYFVVDVDRLAAQKPALHRHVIAEVVALFDRGELKADEITEFPVSKLADAMKFMTRAAYRGKIVLNMQGDRVRTLPVKTAAFRPDRSYLISGGASGFGLEIARWMADRGARSLILVSRSGCKSDADRIAVESLMERGLEVLVAQADLTDPNAVARLVQRIGNAFPPLAGIIHGAAVLDDASIPTMDMARFARVFDPKAQGAWNLHAATVAAGANLDFFVMLSSISSVLGLYGQINYASANYFQDALAHYRTQRGLPGTSVNLGVLGQYAGMSKAENDNYDVITMLEGSGMLVMSLGEALAKLESALIQQPIQRMTARFDWARFRAAYPHLVRDVRFVDLVSDAALARGSRQNADSLREALAALEPKLRLERLQLELAGSLARTLDVGAEQLDVSASIDNLGLDSLMLSQLRNWILRSLDINLPMIKLLKGPSIATLAAELLAQLDQSGNAGGSTTKEGSQDSANYTLADMDGVQVLNPWLIRGRGHADAAMRLICFHSMGVGASLFTKFLLNPPRDYDVLAVQTPGRENRLAEPVVESVEQLVDQLVPQLLPFLDRPFVIWGHSFGGILAREVIRALRDRHHLEPIRLVVTGTVAPDLIHVWQKREILLKAMVVDNSPEYLMSLSRYVDDPEFIKAILPLMRSDFPLLKNYRFESGSPMSCPITAFAARQDDMVYTDEIRDWAHHTDAAFELIEVDGDHWFLNRNRELITATLQDIAARFAEVHGVILEPVGASAATR